MLWAKQSWYQEYYFISEVEISAQLFLSAALCILFFSSTVSHLIISCAPMWSIHGLLYISGWPSEMVRLWWGSLHRSQSLWGCHCPSPSTGCILCSSVSALLIHPWAQSLRAVCDPVWVAHGQCLLCQTTTPSKSTFPACLHQCPLAHSSSISFLQRGLFTFLLTCPLVSCLTSPTASPFMWSHVHPAPVSTTLS